MTDIELMLRAERPCLFQVRLGVGVENLAADRVVAAVRTLVVPALHHLLGESTLAQAAGLAERILDRLRMAAVFGPG